MSIKGKTSRTAKLLDSSGYEASMQNTHTQADCDDKIKIVAGEVHKESVKHLSHVLRVFQH